MRSDLDVMILKRTKVLFLCTHNSCRSQMAEAILGHNYGDRYISYSAGIQATRVDTTAIKVLEELGIDTSGLRSKLVDEFINMEIDMIVTVCDHAKEACPFIPGAREYLHMDFRDPPDLIEAGMEPIPAFRMIRDEISAWLDKEFGD